jgi:hypothetical protein
VPGTPFSLLLSRSLDFQLYYALLKLNLPGSRAARLVISTFQSAWDTVEAGVWLADPIVGHAPQRSLQQQQLLLPVATAVHTTALAINCALVVTGSSATGASAAGSSGSGRVREHVRQQQQQQRQQQQRAKQQCQWFSWRSSSVLKGAGAAVLQLLLPAPQQQQAARALLHDMLVRYDSVQHSYSSSSSSSSNTPALQATAAQQHHRTRTVSHTAAAQHARSAIVTASSTASDTQNRLTAAATAAAGSGGSTYRMPVLIQAGLGDAEVSTVGAEASNSHHVHKLVYSSMLTDRLGSCEQHKPVYVSCISLARAL